MHVILIIVISIILSQSIVYTFLLTVCRNVRSQLQELSTFRGKILKTSHVNCQAIVELIVEQVIELSLLLLLLL